MPASHCHKMRKIWSSVTQIQAKANVYIFLCKTDLSTLNFTPLMHIVIWKMVFPFKKYSSQGGLTVKKRMCDKHLFLLKIIDIFQQQVSMILYPIDFIFYAEFYIKSVPIDNSILLV